MQTVPVQFKDFVSNFIPNVNEQKLFLGPELEDDERELIAKYTPSLNGKLTPLLRKFLEGHNPSIRKTEKEILINFIKQEEVRQNDTSIKQPAGSQKAEHATTAISTVTDMSKRRTIMQLLVVIYGVTIEKGGLEAMVTEARKKHGAMVEKTSILLDPMLGSSKGYVEGAGISKALGSLFGLTECSEIHESEEVNALIRLWVIQYKKNYCAMNTDMPDTMRKEKLTGKKEDLITATAAKLAEFGGYDDIEPLRAEVEALLPEAIAFLRDEAIKI